VRGAREVYFDTVARVDVAKWANDRIALLGDASSCVSLFGDGLRGRMNLPRHLAIVEKSARAIDDKGREATVMRIIDIAKLGIHDRHSLCEDGGPTP
jgi:hypothetical protein